MKRNHIILNFPVRCMGYRLAYIYIYNTNSDLGVVSYATATATAM